MARSRMTYRGAMRNEAFRAPDRTKRAMWSGAPAKVRPIPFGNDALETNGDKPRARRARQIAAGQLRAANGVAS